MLLILSSAKTLVFDDLFTVPETTQPIFKQEGDFLVNFLKKFSEKDLGKLLKVSESLANLNYQRFQSFDTGKKQAAILAYRGDVFKQLQLNQFNNNELDKHDNQVLLNLASDEYSRIIKKEQFHYPILKVSFKEIRNGKLKTIGIMAKKSRGLMTNWIIQNQIDDLSKLQDYSGLGYHYDESLSNEQEMVFTK